jgi:hypothetical protein
MRYVALPVVALAAAVSCSGKSNMIGPPGSDMASSSMATDMSGSVNGDMVPNNKVGDMASSDLAGSPPVSDAGLAPFPDLAGVAPGTVHCKETLDCVNACTGNFAMCEGACLTAATAQARAYYEALKDCAVAECFAPPLSKCTSSDVPNPSSQCAICETYADTHGVNLRCPQQAQNCLNDQ